MNFAAISVLFKRSCEVQVKLRLAYVVVLSGLMLGATGCGSNGDRPELGMVSGTVMLDGKPLPDVIVVFKPEKGRASTATTDDEGHYQLVYRHGVNGAKIGPHVVSFEYPLDEPGPALPDKYTSKSELKEEVSAGANEINFDLKAK
jgi:hypothetical protein